MLLDNIVARVVSAPIMLFTCSAAHAPIIKVEAVFLCKTGDGFKAEWLEEANTSVTIHCDWDAKPESPVGIIIGSWLLSQK